MGTALTHEEQIDRLYGNKTVALSNALAQAKAKTSLLESKIEFLAIYRMNTEMRTREKRDSNGNPYNVHYVDINASEIKTLIGREGGSIYSQIEAAALELKQKIYIFRDPTQKQFKMDSLYGEVSYDSGTLSIEFNPATENLFTELTQNFTKLRLDIAFKFKSNGAFQMYKTLKPLVYELPPIDPSLPQEEQRCIIQEYSLADFRLQLGYVNLNQPDIKREGSKAFPDVEKMVEMEKKPKYKRWRDLYDRVVKVAIDEINQISDIYIASVEKKCIAHGKVDGVSICVQNNKKFYLAQNKKKTDTTSAKEPSATTLSDSQLIDFTDEMRTFIKEPLMTRELQSIAKEANYNMDAIRKAYKVAQTAPRANLVGFLISAIKGDYAEPVKSNGNANKSGFQQRHYSEEELRAFERKKLGLPPEEPSPTEDRGTYIPDTTNKFNQFPQTLYTQADYDDLEYRRLTETPRKPAKKKNAFNDFAGRTYTSADYDDLESRRLAEDNL